MDDLEDLICRLDTKDFADLNAAIQKLIELGGKAVPSLIRAFENQSMGSATRSKIVFVFGSIGHIKGVGPLVLAPLVKTVNDELNHKAVDFEVLNIIPIALGMIAQKRLLSEKQFDTPRTDKTVEMAINTLVKSLMEKTQEYRIGVPFLENDSSKGLRENISFRLNVLRALKMIGDEDAIVDAINFIFAIEPMSEDIQVLIEAAESLGIIGASGFFWDPQRYSGKTLVRRFFNKEYAVNILERVINSSEMFGEVKETARKSLKLIKSTKEASFEALI